MEAGRHSAILLRTYMNAGGCLMPGDGEKELLVQLNRFVDAWTRANGLAQLDLAIADVPLVADSASARTADPRGKNRESVRPDAFLSTAQILVLQTMGYLESRYPGDSLVPTTEALSLTDPWLCPELATSLQAAFHDSFQRWNAGGRGA